MKKRQTVWRTLNDVLDKWLVHNNTAALIQTIMGVGLLILAIVPLFNRTFVNSLVSNIIYSIYLAVICGVALSVLGEAIIIIPARNRRTLQETQQRKREEVLTKRLSALTQEHSELVEFLEIQRIEQEQQEEARQRAERRAFLQGVLQNLIFFLFGVAIPILFHFLHLFGQ